MLRSWARAGFDLKELWATTPRQFNAAIGGYVERLEQQQTGRISLAWHTAWLTSWAYHQPNRMPKLETLVAPKRGRGAEAPVRQSLKEMAGVVKAWRVLFEGAERSRSPTKDAEER